MFVCAHCSIMAVDHLSDLCKHRFGDSKSGDLRVHRAECTNKINQHKSISIMQKFIKDYENNLNVIKNNQIKIYRAIDRYATRRTEVETNFLTATIFSQIENSLQQLYDRLETLENAITFSHQEKMHPSILDASYLIEELNQVQNEINGNLAFPPNINNYQNKSL
ncbi:unnamed protein product [Spodoptera littoralis]|uniref:Uncharacterized protein n=1 Tax=Spodoptera littoralis TaxID=7109 RepID=A0A9P0N355_SPOLI|nr:unnamed protein product [Spodoptera littoralis]CAH1640752.1 unnamed protein product [Spodoptera littoralis]